MRNDYLTVLGARHDWRNFLDQYSRFVLKRRHAGEMLRARSACVARRKRGGRRAPLLVDPKWYGDGCVDLINALAVAQQFTSDRCLAADPSCLRAELYEHRQQDRGRARPGTPGSKRLDTAANTPPLYLARAWGRDSSSHQLALVAITRIGAQRCCHGRGIVQFGCAGADAVGRAIGWGTMHIRQQ